MNANTLGQLFAIREDNRTLLDGLGVLGTALGFKNEDGDPAVLVYVNQKIGEPWLPSWQRVPKTLVGADGRSCPTDVIGSASDLDLQLRVFDQWRTEQGLRPLGTLTATEPLSETQLDLRDRLRGKTERLTPGCQLAYRDKDGGVFHGTLACFVRDSQTRRIGILTDQHVGKFPGNLVAFPDIEHRPVGIFRRGVLEEPVEARYGRLPAATGDSWSNLLRLDAGFCELVPSLDYDAETERRLPVLEGEELKLRSLGRPLPLDLDTMGPVGSTVIGVGRTRSFQRGTIQAFSFEFLDSSRGVREYNDYLIVGEGGGEFSDGGDSGKLIVQEKGLRPVALMWGGEWSRRRHGRELENWTNATDINLVLDRLGIDILSS